jgi:hypothetical protein
MAFNLRKISIALGILGCLGVVLYVSAYLHLRSRGLREMQITNIEAILYISVNDIEDVNDFKTHHLRAEFFSPLNFIDRKCFKGKGPPRCILTDLD